MKKADFKNLKKHAEVKGKPRINWYARLKQKNITEKEWSKWRDQSQSWTTCACGNACAIIPRDSMGEPQDFQLSRLGAAFYSAICDRNIDKAKKVLDKIEKRSPILIQKELDKLKGMGIPIC